MSANPQNFDYPSNTPVVDTDTGMATNPWQTVFSRWHSIIVTGQQSGVTAKRPVDQVWIGRQFFDTSLGKPVYVKSVKPIVWVDASGAVV